MQLIDVVNRLLNGLGIQYVFNSKKGIAHEKQVMKKDLEREIFDDMNKSYKLDRGYELESFAPIVVNRITGKVGFQSYDGFDEEK